MHISCNTELVEGLAIEEQLRLVADAGFSHVNLGGDRWRGRRMVFRAPFAELRKALSDLPLSVDWVHAPFIWPSLDTADEEHWHVSIAAHRFYLERAAELQARACVIHPFFDTLKHADTPKATYARVIEASGELAGRARELGLSLAIENMPYPEHHELVEAMLDAIPPLGFCLDVGHVHIVGNWDQWQRHLPRLVCTHFHDNHGTDDEHLYPGDGTVDWSMVRGKLLDAEYTGVWGLEVLTSALGETISAVPPADRMKRACACARMITGEEST